MRTDAGWRGNIHQACQSRRLSQFNAKLTFERKQTFKLGNALFRKLWVSSPFSTLASDGLGPLFNARACQSCHIKIGRGHTPEAQSRVHGEVQARGGGFVSSSETGPFDQASQTLAWGNQIDAV
ncbi:di-heme oxidoredictase family protein [Hoeflea halophila]|uniref:di-heme oxidoredictase family protein n=1 Tax=Hoeflea halophila TaxID=714899 RepID=UPI003CCD694D